MTQETKLAFREDGLGADEDLAEASLMPLVVSHPSVLRKHGKKLVTTLTLSSRTCKWPFGDPATSDFHYCGQPPQTGRPYCDTHDAMSYQAAPRRR